MITKFFKVTLIKYYALDYHSEKNIVDDVSMINGWSSEKVKNNWFKETSLDSFHATRDVNEIGNATQIINIERVDIIKPFVDFRDKLIKKLKALKKIKDFEQAHTKADTLLVEYINNKKVTEAYEKIEKHYA